MVNPEDIKQWIEEGLENAQAQVAGDGHHFEAMIVCDAFAGKSMIQQHQMVYRVLGDRMKEQIHALSMKTYTQDEYAAQQNN